MRLAHFITIVAALTTVACNRQPVVSEQSKQESDPFQTDQNAEANAQAEIADLRSQILDLQQRIERLDARAGETERMAREARDLADEADSKARKACEPYGYQSGCGNSP